MIRPRTALLILTVASTLCCLVLWTACGGGGASMPQQGSPVANLSASTLTFASQAVATTSSPVTLTLDNSGTAPLNIAGISFANSNGEFAQTNSCGASLAVGANCSISVTFTPSKVGSATAASLNVADNAADSPQSITIKGNGVTPSNIDPMGTAAGIETSCSSIQANQGEPNGVCYNVETTCPGIANQTVGVKVNNPSGTKGTVTFMVGGTAIEWYDQNFKFGTNAIDAVAQAGFTTAQLSFYSPPANYPPGGTFAGWLSGPGGLRALSCRFATVSMWVRDHIRQQNAPFCHTGNSAGSGAPFYALAYYGFNSYYNFVELTSGPPFTHIDKGCICVPEQFNQVTCGGTRAQSECYRQNDATQFLDPAYDPTTHICSDSLNGDTTYKQKFINDSLDTPGAAKNFPNVDIHFVFGGQDLGPEEPQALELIPLITAKNPITYSCVLDAPHPIADVLDGAQQIANDVIAGCH
jgi:HYDIN/CFA65/VesB family protein